MIKKKNISNIDKENWDKYIKDPSDIFDKELIDNKKFSNKFRFKFDLHGYNLEEANKKLPLPFLFLSNICIPLPSITFCCARFLAFGSIAGLDKSGIDSFGTFPQPLKRVDMPKKSTKNLMFL